MLEYVRCLVSDELAGSIETSCPSTRVGVDGGDVGGGGLGQGVLVRVVGNLGVNVGFGSSDAHGINSRLSRVGVDEGVHGGEDVVGAGGGAEEALAGGRAGAAVEVCLLQIGVGDESLGSKECGPLWGLPACHRGNVSLASLSASRGLSSVDVGL